MYQWVKKGWAKHLDFILLDLGCILASYYAAYVMRHGSIGLPNAYLDIMAIILMWHMTLAFFTNNYKSILRRGIYQEARAVFVHMLMVTVGIVTYMFFRKIGSDYSRQVIFTTFLLGNVTCYAERLIHKNYLRRIYAHTSHMRSIMLVCNAADVERMIEKLTPNTIRNYQITSAAVIDQDMTGAKFGNVTVVANRDNLFQYAVSEVVDEVLMDISDHQELEHDMAEQFLDMGITVHINVDKQFEDFPNRIFERVGGFNVMTTSIKMVSFRQLFFKRCLDICGAIVGLMITAVVSIFVVPAIYIESPGPVIFSQVRVGKHGRKFRIYKFRSMHMDAEKRKAELMEQNKMQGLMFKMDDDPRITKVGKFIRKTSIDELPQFFNVLKGDMSLVGTRPPTVDEYEQYDYHHKIRLSIKPGMTGMWQVSGRSDITDFEEVVKLDSQYINNWNVGMDMKLIWQTVQVVLSKSGAK